MLRYSLACLTRKINLSPFSSSASGLRLFIVLGGLVGWTLVSSPPVLAQTIAPLRAYSVQACHEMCYGSYPAETPLGTVQKEAADMTASVAGAFSFTTWCNSPAECCHRDTRPDDALTWCHNISTILLCPSNYVFTPPFCSLPSNQPDPDKMGPGGPGPSGECKGNPCNPASGNKFEVESDYRDADGTLMFTRIYNSFVSASTEIITVDLGTQRHWSARLNRTIRVNANGTISSAAVRRADGKIFYFTNYGGLWTPDADIHDFLAPTATGWNYTKPDGSRETYENTSDVFGSYAHLVSETDATGRTISYSYDANNRLATITGPFGHALTLAYDTQGRLSTLTDPAGKVITYTYDDTYSYSPSASLTVTFPGTLKQVSYPDATAKLYHYENASFSNYLTGISYVDTSGTVTRYSTYAYDTTGKAITTEHAQTDNGAPQEKFTLAYDVPALNQTTVTDPVGMNEIMTFSTNLGVKNLVNKVNQSDSKSVAQVFDANNNLTCRKDEENRVTLNSYNATNQKLSLTEGLSGSDCNTCLANPANCNVGGVGRVTTYDYLSPTLDLPRFIRRPSVAAGQTFETEIVYGDAGHPNLPTQIIQRGYTPAGTSVSRTVTLGYNPSGQVNSLNGPRTDVNDVTTLDYYTCTTGNACGQLQRIANALGHITTYDLYDANGRLLQMTDPNGLRTGYTYDPRGRVKTATQTPTSGSAALWQYRYTPWGDVSQAIDPDGVVLNYGYDAAHYLKTIADAAGNQIRYAYDLKGNRITDYTYDPSGVLTRSVGYAYDLRNHVSSINLAGNVTQRVSDAVGNLTAETDPNLHTTARTPDALNRLMSSLDALNGTTGYGYDLNDRPVAVTAPNNLTTEYRYDDLGNLLSEVSPDRGTTAYTGDTAGNILTVTDARNITTTYTYDALNRMLSKQSSDASTPAYAYVYDSCGRGRLCYLQQNGGIDFYFFYDALGRLNYQINGTGISWPSSSYVFSPAGRLTQITYPNNRTVSYQYDSAGRVSQVSTTSGAGVTTPLASGFTYSPFGPVSGFTFGNGQTYQMNLDQAYRPTYQKSGPRVKTAAYDPAGNVQSLTDASATQTFTYDALNELAAATDTQAGSYGSLSYLYYPHGNRRRETRNGVNSKYFYYDNRLTNTPSRYWLYDAAGNATWSSYAYVTGYNGYGRLTSTLSGAVAYGYNARDQRVSKYAGGTATAYHYGLNGELLYENDGSGPKDYIYLNGLPLARADKGAIYYYHTDHLGAPQLMTNSAGAVVWQASYEPFGNATVTMQAVANNVRYPGMYADSETGLYYNNARYYDPKIGRYISSDPIGLRGGLNTYLYARANPLRYIDPSGLGAAGVAGEVITYVGGAAAVGGLATGNPLLFYGGLGVAAVGGALQVYDTHQEGEEAKNAIDKAQELANKIKERQNEEQQKIDKLFPPKSTPPNCPNGQSR